MMRLSIIYLFHIIILSSCNNVDRDRPVDKSKLTGRDYRLFQNTPAWDLAKAVQDEDEMQINNILAEDPDLVNYQDPKYGNTLLKLTVMNQQKEPFMLLLEHDADVNIHNTYSGKSAIIEASRLKEYDISFVKKLIKYGADVNDVEVGERKEGNTTRKTPLIEASESGNLPLVKFLLKQGADINYTNEFGQSAFTEAVRTKEYKIVVYLLKQGADYKQPVFYRPTNDAVHDPTKDKPIYLVDVLREDIFDLNSENYQYKMQIVDFLKSKGIDYRATPIPEYIRKKAQEKYPNRWENYLEKY